MLHPDGRIITLRDGTAGFVRVLAAYEAYAGSRYGRDRRAGLWEPIRQSSIARLPLTGSEALRVAV